MRKIIVLFIVALIVGSLLFWRATHGQKAEIKIVEVKRETIIKSISASGKVASQEEVELKFQTSGQLVWVGVKEGDRVKAWQAITQLDTRELQKTFEKSLRDYSKQRNDFEEMYRVTYREQTPQSAFTDTVRRILEKNQWDLEKAVIDVELKDIAVKFSTLVTPISGIVTRVDVPVTGVNITPATSAIKIANPEKMIFKANIDEADIAGIIPGLLTKIVLDTYPEKVIEAKIDKVGFSSVITSGGGTAFPVEITLPKNDNLQFKLGMNGDTEIILDKKDQVLTLPAESVSKQEENWFVWLVKNGRAKRQQVTLGLITDENVEIISGLNENDKVIKSATLFVKDDQKI